MAERDVDVLVAGFGPVGATVTALLASGPDPWAGVPHGVRELATRFGVEVLRIDLPPGKADGEEVAIGDPGGEALGLPAPRSRHEGAYPAGPLRLRGMALTAAWATAAFAGTASQ